jgi:hypothetical protein
MTVYDLDKPDASDLCKRVERSGIMSMALEPFATITARVFEIELNVRPSQETLDRLGGYNFSITCRKRPYNVEKYSNSPEMRVRALTKQERKVRVFIHRRPRTTVEILCAVPIAIFQCFVFPSWVIKEVIRNRNKE